MRTPVMLRPSLLTQATAVPLLLLTLAGAGWVACRPPDLPCNKDEDWMRICAGDGGLMASGGTSGSSGSGGGPAGTGGMATDAPVAGAINANTPVADCAQYPTLGAMDQFFQSRCADQAACHQNALFADYKMPNVWQRVRPLKTVGACTGSNFVDPGGDLSKSVMWVKTQEKPTCANGDSAGVRMPNPPAMPLNAVESKCLENFLKALKTP
jgi:hypothetical protein